MFGKCFHRRINHRCAFKRPGKRHCQCMTSLKDKALENRLNRKRLNTLFNWLNKQMDE